MHPSRAVTQLSGVPAIAGPLTSWGAALPTADRTPIPTLDGASGYDYCGVCAFFDWLYEAPLSHWTHVLDAPGSRHDAHHLDESLTRALGAAHPWAVWRARDEVATALWHLRRAQGLRLHRDALARLEQRIERVALAIVARDHLEADALRRICLSVGLLGVPPRSESRRRTGA